MSVFAGKKFKKNYSLIGADLLELLRAERCVLKLKYEKNKKSIFSIDNANISKLFLLDKLVSGLGL
jgi:hypothetical protein